MGSIFLADELNRYERWDQIREELTDGSAAKRASVDFDDSKPWNTILRLSTFGVTSDWSYWWYRRVTAVCSSSSSASAAQLEGSMRVQDISAPGGRRTSKTRSVKNVHVAKGSKKAGVCYAWNQGVH